VPTAAREGMIVSETFNWTEDQWNRVRQVVHDEALNARVAASFLPLYGPLPSDTVAVPINQLQPIPDGATNARLEVDDYTTMRLTTLSVNVYLKNSQVADPELSSAMIMFRRAADIIARLEDALIFNGQDNVGAGPKGGAGTSHLTPVYSISGGHANPGLLGAEGANTVDITGDFETPGQAVFHSVVDAIQCLEGQGHYGPFACAMGDDLFREITRPMPDSMVLPRDSILPFLNGPLCRTSAVPNKSAVVISLQGAPVEIVVPGEISVRYLQTTSDAEHVFRVQQKFALRVKEAKAVATFCL
jgi:uncharacterized linocin/CFP29 family protein